MKQYDDYKKERLNFERELEELPLKRTLNNLIKWEEEAVYEFNKALKAYREADRTKCFYSDIVKMEEEIVLHSEKIAFIRKKIKDLLEA